MQTVRARALLLLVLVAGSLAAVVAPAARAQETVDLAYFRARLGAWGAWVEHSRWGPVWHPAKVDAGWRPYLHGRWVRTDEYGWYWQSNEDFGWAVFHYGRWARDAQHGWIWVPGTVWGPGWVAWRVGGGYVGWAALPPGVGYDDKAGLVRGKVNLRDAAYSAHWVFVPARSLLSSPIDRYVVSPARTPALLRATRDATRYERRNGQVFNRGPAPTVVNGPRRRRAPAYRRYRPGPPRDLRRALERLQREIRRLRRTIPYR